MKKIIFILIIELFSFSINAQKSSISIKFGHIGSGVDSYDIPGYDTTHTLSRSSIEIGIGYTYKLKEWFWLSIEPGFKNIGYKYQYNHSAISGIQSYSALYFNSPIVSTFNIGRNKTIVAMDLGYNPNYSLSKIPPMKTNFSEILVGLRLGYKISERIAIEAYYRYGESLRPFIQKEAMTTNYISIQTRLFIGKKSN